MALSIDSKLKDLAKDPEARAIIERTFDVDLGATTMKVAYGMTLRKLCTFPQSNIDEEGVAKLEAEIAALGH